MKFIKKILLFANLVLSILTLISYLAPFVDPNSTWVLSFFGLAYPYFLLGNFIFIILWISRGSKNAFLSIIVVLIGFHYIRETFVWKKPGEKSERGVKILSYNLNQGYYLYEKKIGKGELENYLIEKDPDICLLQEINTSYIQEEIKGLKTLGYKLKLADMGTGIYSKYPFIKKGIIDFTMTTNSCVWGDLKVGGDTLRVYSVHFKSNQISKQAEDFVAVMEKENKIESKNVKSILRNYKNNVQIRAEQVKKVKDHILKSPHPVIIGGDFNDPPVSYTYREFNDFLQDAFKERGLGFGISYLGVIPFLRIDYLFVSKGIKILEFNTDSKKYSDHYPIEAKVKI
jgi:endonuclease/exonuclease/phosphatase family metal-dependent hydrolase